MVNFTVAIPIICTLTLQSNALTLQWSGGLPPYQVQMATNVAAPSWNNLGSASTNTSMTLQLGADPVFYRIAGR